MSKPRTKTRDPRSWRSGKRYKTFKSTNRFLRRRGKQQALGRENGG